MAQQTLNNLETGLIARGKINSNFDEVYQNSRAISPDYSATASENVTAINEALVTAGANGYDLVNLPKTTDGIVEISSPVYVTTKVSFLGTGLGSTLKASDDFVGDALVMLKVYDSTTYAEQFNFGNMTIDGNKDSQKVACTFSNATNIIQDVAHGLSDGDKVRFVLGSGATLPSTLSKYLTYYVVNKNADDFQVSATSGGSAITFTGDGTGSQYYYEFTRDGVKFDVPGGASFEYVGDNFGNVSRLFIRDCSANGIHIPTPSVTPQRAIAMNFSGINLRTNGDSGIKTFGSDSFYSNINSIANGNGFLISGGNNSLVNCKSFYNDVTGLLCSTGSVGTKVANFEAQEDLTIGVRLFDTQNVTITNLVSESHGHSGDGTQVVSANAGEGVGIEISTAKDCHIQGIVNNRTSLAGWIKWATRWYGSATSNANTTIDIKMPDMGRTIPLKYEAIPADGSASSLIVDSVDVFATQSKTYDPPSLADGEGVTTTVSVVGATLGQRADASFSNAQDDVLLNAWVSATDIVSARFQNESSGVVDLLSGTLYVNVART